MMDKQEREELKEAIGKLPTPSTMAKSVLTRMHVRACDPINLEAENSKLQAENKAMRKQIEQLEQDKNAMMQSYMQLKEQLALDIPAVKDIKLL